MGEADLKKALIVFPEEWSLHPAPSKPRSITSGFLFESLFTKRREPIMDNRMIQILDKMQTKFPLIDIIGTIYSSDSYDTRDRIYPKFIILANGPEVVYMPKPISEYSPGDKVDDRRDVELMDALQKLIGKVPW